MGNKIKPGVVWSLVVFAVVACGFLVWRYAPVRVRADTIHKVVLPDANEFNQWLCNKFAMTAEEFNAYFASTHRLTKDEEDEYDYGMCYYEAKINQRQYRVWIGGMAQIKEGDDIALFAATSRKVPASPE